MENKELTIVKRAEAVYPHSMTLQEGYKVGATSQQQIAQAEFIKLIEGEIDNHKRKYHKDGIDDDFIIWQYLETRLKTKAQKL